MTEPDDMEERVSALEDSVGELRGRVSRAEQDAAAARVLAGGADRDVADLGGEVREFHAEVRAEFADVRGELRTFRDQNNRVLSAMRVDLTDMRREVGQRFEQVNQGFVEMRGRFDAVAAVQQRTAGLLDAVLRQLNDRPGT
jgi:hypothetical protein